MNLRLLPCLPILAHVLAAPLAAQEARDFQLPPAASASSEPRVQGPVDPDAPVIVRPRVIETARPTSPTPDPTATVLPTPAPNAPTRTIRPAAGATSIGRPTAAAVGTPAPVATAAISTEPGSPVSAPPAEVATPPLRQSEATPTVTPTPPALPLDIREPAFPWIWLSLGTALALAGLGGWLVSRRRKRAGQAAAIIVPRSPVVEADTDAAPAEGLALAVEAMRLDRSMLNATVGYRITLRNRTAEALTGVTVEADLISASSDLPTDQQLASPMQALTPRHATGRIAAGQSLRFEGQVRLPLSQAAAIRQGRIGLLVPLLRVRATADSSLPVATTLVIGRSEGVASRPQPFRLDEPPRSYAPLAQRVLDAVPAGG